MADLVLKRFDRREDKAFGALIGPKGAFAVTLELPWRNNEQRVSHIPAGRYECRRFFSPRFKIWCFEIVGVPGRDKCLFHPANIVAQLEGCIAIGHGFDPVQVPGHELDEGITQSKKEFAEFMQLQDGLDWFWLDIIDC